MARQKQTLMVSAIVVPIIAVTFLFLPVSVSAGTLGPKKASELVRVIPASPPNPCVNIALNKVDTLVSADGSQSSFVIPDGKVLVVTAVSALISGAPPNTSLVGALFRDSATPDIVAAASFTTDAIGNGSGTVTLPTGVAFTPTNTMCAAPGVELKVYGYLVKDN